MLYTSGTTGRPEGRAPSRPAPDGYAAGRRNIYRLRRAGDDVHLCTGPLYHAAPLAFSLVAAARLRRAASC